MVKAPFRDSYILPQKLLSFTDIYPNTQGGIYLCSWQFINGGIGFADVGTVILFDLQSAVLAVILEWKYPIRNWKTESDLWHHLRKYLVPLIMLLMAAFVGTWALILWIWSAIMLIECCVLVYVTRRL